MNPEKTGPGRVLTLPNMLTFLRLALIPFFVAASLEGQFELALIILIVAALTDVLDGSLARWLNQRSRLGALLDPAADKSMMVCGYILYTVPGVAPYPLPGWLTFTVFIRDVLIVLFAYLVYTRVKLSRFPPSIAGKLSTLLQVIALSVGIAVNTALAPVLAPISGALFSMTMLLTLYSGFDYLRRGDTMLRAQIERESTQSSASHPWTA